jgi:hypothetical protein
VVASDGLNCMCPWRVALDAVEVDDTCIVTGIASELRADGCVRARYMWGWNVSNEFELQLLHCSRCGVRTDDSRVRSARVLCAFHVTSVTVKQAWYLMPRLVSLLWFH